MQKKNKGWRETFGGDVFVAQTAVLPMYAAATA